MSYNLDLPIRHVILRTFVSRAVSALIGSLWQMKEYPQSQSSEKEPTCFHHIKTTLVWYVHNEHPSLKIPIPVQTLVVLVSL